MKRKSSMLQLVERRFSKIIEQTMLKAKEKGLLRYSSMTAQFKAIKLTIQNFVKYSEYLYRASSSAISYTSDLDNLLVINCFWSSSSLFVCGIVVGHSLSIRPYQISCLIWILSTITESIFIVCHRLAFFPYVTFWLIFTRNHYGTMLLMIALRKRYFFPFFDHKMEFRQHKIF